MSFKELYTEAHQPKLEKTNNVIIGDSMIKKVNGRNVSRGNSVKFRPHPVVSTEDLIDHIKRAIRNEPDIAVIIHASTNDLQNHCNILKKEKKLVSAIKKMKKDRKNCIL